MSGWKLGLDGFVTHFMVSGPQEEPYFNEAKDKNQLLYEAYPAFCNCRTQTSW